MESFRSYLQQEFVRRNAKNSQYSLRAFAAHLGVNHATLSTYLSGKRKLTRKSVEKLAVPLGLNPSQLRQFLTGPAPESSVLKIYHPLADEIFATTSDWLYDAIVEMSQIAGIRLTPETIATSFEISPVRAKIALETLLKVGLLQKNSQGRLVAKFSDSSNILDADQTSIARRQYQKSVLEKSTEALEEIPRSERDHTSVTMAMNVKDLPEAKKRIQDFRRSLHAFLQRDGVPANEVYQFQVSLFPLSRMKTHRKVSK